MTAVAGLAWWAGHDQGSKVRGKWSVGGGGQITLFVGVIGISTCIRSRRRRRGSKGGGALSAKGWWRRYKKVPGWEIEEDWSWLIKQGLTIAMRKTVWVVTTLLKRKSSMVPKNKLLTWFRNNSEDSVVTDDNGARLTIVSGKCSPHTDTDWLPTDLVGSKCVR